MFEAMFSPSLMPCLFSLPSLIQDCTVYETENKILHVVSVSAFSVEALYTQCKKYESRFNWIHVVETRNIPGLNRD